MRLTVKSQDGSESVDMDKSYGGYLLERGITYFNTAYMCTLHIKRVSYKRIISKTP